MIAAVSNGNSTCHLRVTMVRNWSNTETLPDFQFWLQASKRPNNMFTTRVKCFTTLFSDCSHNEFPRLRLHIACGRSFRKGRKGRHWLGLEIVKRSDWRKKSILIEWSAFRRLHCHRLPRPCAQISGSRAKDGYLNIFKVYYTKIYIKYTVFKTQGNQGLQQNKAKNVRRLVSTWSPVESSRAIELFWGFSSRHLTRPKSLCRRTTGSQGQVAARLQDVTRC